MKPANTEAPWFYATEADESGYCTDGPPMTLADLLLLVGDDKPDGGPCAESDE